MCLGKVGGGAFLFFGELRKIKLSQLLASLSTNHAPISSSVSESLALLVHFTDESDTNVFFVSRICKAALVIYSIVVGFLGKNLKKTETG